MNRWGTLTAIGMALAAYDLRVSPVIAARADAPGVAVVDDLFALNRNGPIRPAAVLMNGFQVMGGINAPPPTGTTLTVCPTGCDYTTLNSAVIAADALPQSAEPIDVQILPSGAGTVNIGAGLHGITNDMTVEYTGAVNLTNPAVVLQAGTSNSNSIITLGNASSQLGHPVVVLKNFGVSAQGVTSGALTRCIQDLSGSLTMYNMSVLGHFFCNNGVEGNDWRLQSGTWDIESSYFVDDGGGGGPGHAVYCGFGTCILNNSTIYNTVVGFGFKSRGTVTVATNNYISSDSTSGVNNPAGSAADIQISGGGSVIITGNTLIMSLGTTSTATPPTAIQLNGFEGYEAGGPGVGGWNTTTVTIGNNTFINSEPSVQGVAVNNTWPDAVVNMTSNVVDVHMIPLRGKGTLTANVDSHGTAIANGTQDILQNWLPVLADYRGTSIPQDYTITNSAGSNGGAVFGGNGALTVVNASTYNVVANSFIFGGIGGLDATANSTAQQTNVWTYPGSTNTYTSLNEFHPYGFYFGFGNDTVNLADGTAGVSEYDTMNVMLGGTVNLNMTTAVTAQTTVDLMVSGDFTLTAIDNTMSQYNAYPGSISNLFGEYHYVFINGTEAAVNIDWCQGTLCKNPKIEISGGVYQLQYEGNFLTTTYDDGGALVSETVDIMPYAFTIQACGGGNFHLNGTFAVSAETCSSPYNPANFWTGPGSGDLSVGNGVATWQLAGTGTYSAGGNASGGAGTYEIVPAGTGLFIDTRTFRPASDSVLMATGMSVTSNTAVAGNRVIVFDNGGTLQFNGYTGTINVGTFTP